MEDVMVYIFHRLINCQSYCLLRYVEWEIAWWLV